MKCSSCGARWRATPEVEPEPAAEPELMIETAPAVAMVAEEAEPPRGPGLDLDDLEIVAADAPAPEPVKAKPVKDRKPMGKRGVLVGLATAASLVVALGAGAVVFRDQVVGVLPDTAALYASAGLPAHGSGLVIQAIKTQATFQGGRPVLSVTGEIRNTLTETVSSPAMRVSLLDPDGKPLATKLVKPLNPAVPGRSKRYFAIGMADPPAGFKALEVVFDETRPADKPETVEIETAPLEAHPLPPGSPDALPEQHG